MEEIISHMEGCVPKEVTKKEEIPENQVMSKERHRAKEAFFYANNEQKSRFTLDLAIVAKHEKLADFGFKLYKIIAIFRGKRSWTISIQHKWRTIYLWKDDYLHQSQ